MTPVSLQDTQLFLLPEKAAYLPDWEALLVSDVHLGKAETFQRYGIPVPHQVNQATLDRLQRICDRTQARQMYILGDLFHSQWGLVDEVMESWLRFQEATSVEIHLILGNHDLPLVGKLPRGALIGHGHPIELSPWTLSHEPLPKGAGINVCGHIHPCVRLGGKGDRLRLPCFYWEPDHRRLTLPSFGEFTGGHEVGVDQGTTAYVIADDAIVPFP